MLIFKVEVGFFGAIPAPGLQGSPRTITSLVDALKDLVSLTTASRTWSKTIDVVEIGRCRLARTMPEAQRHDM